MIRPRENITDNQRSMILCSVTFHGPQANRQKHQQHPTKFPHHPPHQQSAKLREALATTETRHRRPLWFHTLIILIIMMTDKYSYRTFFMILTSLCFLLQFPLFLIYLLLENQMSIRYSNSYQPSHAQEMSLVVLTSKGD